LLIEAVDGLFGDGAVRELDEGESPWPAGVTVDGDDDLRRLTDGAEVRSQIGVGGAKGHIAYEQTYSQLSILLTCPMGTV
jgi:hypothetical protein